MTKEFLLFIVHIFLWCCHFEIYIFWGYTKERGYVVSFCVFLWDSDDEDFVVTNVVRLPRCRSVVLLSLFTILNQTQIQFECRVDFMLVKPILTLISHYRGTKTEYIIFSSLDIIFFIIFFEEEGGLWGLVWFIFSFELFLWKYGDSKEALHYCFALKLNNTKMFLKN